MVRQVTTSAWLGVDHQGRGYGTEARAGLLNLAFDHLGATAALTEVFQDSQGVSRKLGYERDGISVDGRDGEAVVSDRLRLTLQRWRQHKRPAVTVDGLDSLPRLVRALIQASGSAADRALRSVTTTGPSRRPVVPTTVLRKTRSVGRALV